MKPHGHSFDVERFKSENGKRWHHEGLQPRAICIILLTEYA